MARERCGHLISRHDIIRMDRFTVGEDENAFLLCLRPEGHKGPHLIQRTQDFGGTPVLVQLNICKVVYGKNGCDCCASEDPDDWCLAYAEIDIELAKQYLNSLDLVGPGWNE